MNKYCLYGKTEKSYSPLIHNYLFNRLNLDAIYEIYKGDNLIEDLRSGKYDGANVTVPYKVSIMPFLDIIDEKAKRIGAINTILVKDGKLIGYNTDYDGFLDTMKHYNVNAKNAHILGSGGASKAVQAVLNDLGISYTIVSRNDCINTDIDLLINATSVINPVSDEVFLKAKTVIDLHYNVDRFINGLYMLVSQAIKADEIWLGKKMDVNEVFNFVKEEIKNE